MSVIKIKFSEAEEKKLFYMCELVFCDKVLGKEEDIMEDVAEVFQEAMWRQAKRSVIERQITRVSVAPKLSPLIVLDPPLKPFEKAYYVAVQVTEVTDDGREDQVHYVQAYVRKEPAPTWTLAVTTPSGTFGEARVSAFVKTWLKSSKTPKWNITSTDRIKELASDAFTIAVLFEFLTKLEQENTLLGLKSNIGEEVVLPEAIYDWLLDILFIDPLRIFRHVLRSRRLVTVVKSVEGFKVLCERQSENFILDITKDEQAYVKYEKFLSVFLSDKTVVEFVQHLYVWAYDLSEVTPHDWLESDTFSKQMRGKEELSEIFKANQEVTKAATAKVAANRKQNYLKLRKSRF